MMTSLNRIAPYVLSLFRFIIGFLFIEHGLDKVFGGLITHQVHAGGGGLEVAGAYIELVGGALILVGLLTRFAAFICSGQMAVAYFLVHASGGFWPVANGGERAVFYCFGFFYLVFAGPGPISLDALFLEKLAD